MGGLVFYGLPLVDGRKTHNLKVMSYVLLRELTEDYCLGDSLSTLRKCSEEVKEEPGYIGVFAEKKI